MRIKKKESVNIRRISIVGNDTLATNHLPATPVLLSSVVKISKEAWRKESAACFSRDKSVWDFHWMGRSCKDSSSRKITVQPWCKCALSVSAGSLAEVANFIDNVVRHILWTGIYETKRRFFVRKMVDIIQMISIRFAWKWNSKDNNILLLISFDKFFYNLFPFLQLEE